jgi:hypothetical protein
VAKVSVGRKHAGCIDAPPWKCVVTTPIKRGGNDIKLCCCVRCRASV